MYNIFYKVFVDTQCVYTHNLCDINYVTILSYYFKSICQKCRCLNQSSDFKNILPLTDNVTKIRKILYIFVPLSLCQGFGPTFVYKVKLYKCI